MAKQLQAFETPFDVYTEVGLLGEGGAGRVYEVRNDKNQTFALKCLSPDRITAERRKRFKNEIGFCQRTIHRNIVRVLDTGILKLKGVMCPFYVMPKCKGTLRSLIASTPATQVLALFAQVLDGVEAAHKLDVWHRDLKPENMLWDGSSLVIADFGIAHFEEEAIYTAVETRIASRMANFLYSAPEQRARGAPVDRRADIFSLGLILNEMFTHEVPQGAGYRTINNVAPDFAYLDPIVDRMIQSSPERRYQSIDEIKLDLIEHKNAYVAQQRLDEATRQVVPSATPPTFEPLTIIDFDYSDGTLVLQLDRNVPSGWAQEFHQPRGGHRAVMGYGPETFKIQGRTVAIKARESESLIQSLIDNAKSYVGAANRGYVLQQQEQAARQERAEREANERRVAEAQLRANIFKKVKL
jgi:serine/threonine protein kinase